MLLQPQVLDYWRGFDASAVVEAPSLLQLVAPEFNRMTVFDARFPHGVRCVEGVHDPRKARRPGLGRGARGARRWAQRQRCSQERGSGRQAHEAAGRHKDGAKAPSDAGRLTGPHAMSLWWARGPARSKQR